MSKDNGAQTPQKVAGSTSPLADQRPPHQQQQAQQAAQQAQGAPNPDEAAEALARPARPGRKPLGRQEAKLAYPERPGFKRRWINDKPGRVNDAKLAGYSHVEEGGSKPVERTVGTAEHGGGLKAYLMEIPVEFYNEDFAEKQQSLDEIDGEIFRGTFKQEPGDNRYVPQGGIAMRVQRGR